MTLASLARPHELPARCAASAPILIVEDAPPLGLVLRLCLESDGYRVVLARDGQHALACIGAVPPSLILLDLNEPTAAEWALLAQLREGACGIPIVVLSGGYRARPEAVVRGAAGWVAKPFELEELLATVQRVSERSTGP